MIIPHRERNEKIVTVRLTKKMYAAIKKKAKESKVTATDVIRFAVFREVVDPELKAQGLEE